MYARYRRRAGMVWLGIILVGTIASGEAWALTLFVFIIVTFLFLGLERIVKMVLGQQG